MTAVFAVTAFVSDVDYVKRYLAPLIEIAETHNAILLVYDQYDQSRGLAVLGAPDSRSGDQRVQSDCEEHFLGHSIVVARRSQNHLRIGNWRW
jgi:hypothetical protein